MPKDTEIFPPGKRPPARPRGRLTIGGAGYEGPSTYFRIGVGLGAPPAEEPRPPDSDLNDAAHNIARVLVNSGVNRKTLHYDELVDYVCNLGDDQPAVRWALHVLLAGGMLGIEESVFVVALPKLWLWHYSRGKPLPEVAHKPANGKRPCYDRDHLFLRWKEQEGLRPAAIRDRWNGLHPAETVGNGREGFDVARKGIEKAKAEVRQGLTKAKAELKKPKAGRRGKK